MTFRVPRSLIALSACGVIAMTAMTAARTDSLSPREQALHALNRLGFGPRPGDVDRVVRMGVSAYVREQLYPERIPDARLDARLSGYSTLAMTNAQLIERFEVPFREAKRKMKAQRSAAADDADRVHAVRAGVEDQRLAGDQLGHPPGQLGGLDALGASADDADRVAVDLAEAAVLLEAKPLTDQGVVADLGVGVERQVISGDRELGFERGAEPPRHPLAERQRLGGPEEAVMSERELGSGVHGGVDEGPVRRHPAGQL